MKRPLVLLAVASLAAALVACQDRTAETTQAPAVTDPVISDPDLTIPPEEASAPPPIGMETQPGATPPVLPPEEGVAPSPADSPPAPDA